MDTGSGCCGVPAAAAIRHEAGAAEQWVNGLGILCLRANWGNLQKAFAAAASSIFAHYVITDQQHRCRLGLQRAPGEVKCVEDADGLP
jgi:hypothetical protein